MHTPLIMTRKRQLENQARTLIALVVGLALIVLSPRASALVINGENATSNYRFTSGFPSSPVLNTSGSFVASGYDLSGVGWGTESTRNYTMINSQYFLYATHYPPATAEMFFYSSSNGVVTYTIDTAFSLTLEYPFATPGNHLKSDLSVGRLTTTLNPVDNITVYPILNRPTGAEYLGLNLLVYGWSAAVGTGVINGLGPQNLYWNNNTPAIAADDVLNTLLIFDNLNDTYMMTFTQGAAAGEARVEGGDSGSPSFVPWNGGLALVGIHSAVNGSTSFDTFLPSYLPSLQTNGITFQTVPEPSIVWLAGLAGIALIMTSSRSRVAKPSPF